MYTAESIIGHEHQRWQVVDDSLPMFIPVCECANRQWAKDIAAALNQYFGNPQSAGESGELTVQAAGKGGDPQSMRFGESQGTEAFDVE